MLLEKINRLIKRFVKKILFCLPMGGGVIALWGAHLVCKINLNKLKFQGQFLQDMVAYLYFQKSRSGFYVDIGANDGITLSNTYIFEQLGWKGICLEPQPDIFKNLKKIRRCDCYNVALSSVSGDNIDFVKAYGSSLLSGLKIGISDNQKSQMESYGRIGIIKVKTITFDEVMKNYPGMEHIDFLSLDVEGHEIEILKTIDFSKYTFGLMTIEKNDPEQVTDYMNRNGYRIFMEIGSDIMFVPK